MLGSEAISLFLPLGVVVLAVGAEGKHSRWKSVAVQIVRSSMAISSTGSSHG